MDKINLDDRYMSALKKKQKERLTKKQELIAQVRNLRDNYYSINKISNELNLDWRTVKKYLDADTTGVNGNLGVRRKSILNPFIEEINSMIDLGATSTQIESKIRIKGYKGSSSTIRKHISDRKELINSNIKIDKSKHCIIERKLLIKLLFKPIDKIKGISVEVFEKVTSKYSIYKELLDLIQEFRSLLKNKKVEGLNNWIDKALTLNISEITSFVNGINRDIEAVKNAIIYEYNNGLAEGSMNKLKVIKRIMYGRNSFELLRKKVLFLEKHKTFN